MNIFSISAGRRDTAQDFLRKELAVVTRQLAVALAEINFLKDEVETDALTGLKNRRFIDKFDERRGKKDVAVIMVDVDFFKKINDGYGHPVGDEVLKRVAQVIKTCVRDQDKVVARYDDEEVVARYGGEEFVVLLSGVRDIFTAQKRGEAIRRAVEQAAILADMPVTVSVGVAIAPSQKEGVALADKALYRAKQSGRNKVCCAA